MCNNLQQDGFSISAEKTRAILFTRKIKGTELNLKLNEIDIQECNQIKILGLTLDQRLTFKQHVTSLKGKIDKNNQVIQWISHSSFGSDRKTLLRINNALNTSVLSYGQEIFSTATKTHLNLLDSMHRKGIRTAIGAFKTSPAISLLAESGQLPLDIIRMRAIAKLGLKIRFIPCIIV
jgi:hypothetical protein